MRTEDITYCDRECANYQCRRNKAHLPIANYAYYGLFDNCEEYIEEQKNE